MSRLVSGLSFASKSLGYEELLFEWALVSRSYPGWGYQEIKSMTYRERKNWIEMSKTYGVLARKYT
jgi:hypothetical protein